MSTNIAVWSAFDDEMIKIAMSDMTEMEKEALLAALPQIARRGSKALRRLYSRKVGRPLGRAFGESLDRRAALKALKKGKTDKAIWHADVKPHTRVQKVMMADPLVGPTASAVETAVQLRYPYVPTGHVGFFGTAGLSRKLRGKMTGREMFERIKWHPKVGIQGEKVHGKWHPRAK
tara:strand:- start:79 stop:606 length:528 start_codon:yes stop_codon:yes gene_type:complete